MNDRSHLLTEQRLAESMLLDELSIAEAVAVMNQQDWVAVQAAQSQSPQVAGAVEMVSDSLAAGGRLIYVGAGSSGRLGVLDAAECPPTFRSDPEKVQGIIAGGDAAMFRAQEGAEDRSDDGAAAIDAKNVESRDVVMGIAAGGTTPFVHGALERARQRGAKTIFLTCVAPMAHEPRVDLIIRPLTGAEVLTGSTRLKAGTATKLVLNQISTLSMVRIGKVYENLMVDLRAGNAKLRERASRIVRLLTGVGPRRADELLAAADGHVKLAVVMEKRGVDVSQARRILQECNGGLRAALNAGVSATRSG